MRNKRLYIEQVQIEINSDYVKLLNIEEIANSLNRHVTYIMKYLSIQFRCRVDCNTRSHNYRLYTYTTVQDINDNIINFAEEYVQCEFCLDNDTRIDKKRGILLLQCNQCKRFSEIMPSRMTEYIMRKSR